MDNKNNQILSWNKLSIKSQTQQTYLINNLTGTIKSQQILCVMGPSGAGKSSLLSILSGRYSQNSSDLILKGDLTLNNKPINQKTIKKITAFVKQDDVLLSTMTVYETLKFQCDLKMHKLTQNQRNDIVDRTLRKLNLEQCRDTLVGGQFVKSISGGQRKRLAIGIQLISNPKILILDEPTSGLDSHIAYKIFILLKQLALQGKIIITAIHQPSTRIFQQFQKLLLLKTGETIYFGQASGIVPYMQTLKININYKMNPCDFFMLQISNYKRYQNYVTPMTAQAFNKLNEFQQNMGPQQTTSMDEDNQIHNYLHSTKLPPFSIQFKTLLKRSFRSFYRTPSNIIGKSIGMIVFPTLMSTLYQGMGNNYDGLQDFDALQKFFANISSFIFILSFFGLAKNLYDTLLSFTNQKQITMKEISSNLYSLITYFCCRCLIQLPVGIILLLFTAPIVYFVADLAPESQIFIRYLLVLILMSLIGYMMGVLIGVLFSTGAQAAQVVPIFIIPMSLFGGLLVNLRSLPSYIYWLQYLSPLRHCYSFLMQDQLSSSKFDNIIQYQIVKQLAGINGTMQSDFLWLVGLFIILSILSLLVLFRKVQKV